MHYGRRFHLESFSINRFRDCKPGTIVFGPKENFILGKNASGKTTLLQLLAAFGTGNFAFLAAEKAPIDLVWTALSQGLVDSSLDAVFGLTVHLQADRDRQFGKERRMEKFDSSALSRRWSLSIRIERRPLLSGSSDRPVDAVDPETPEVGSWFQSLSSSFDTPSFRTTSSEGPIELPTGIAPAMDPFQDHGGTIWEYLLVIAEHLRGQIAPVSMTDGSTAGAHSPKFDVRDFQNTASVVRELSMPGRVLGWSRRSAGRFDEALNWFEAIISGEESRTSKERGSLSPLPATVEVLPSGAGYIGAIPPDVGEALFGDMRSQTQDAHAAEGWRGMLSSGLCPTLEHIRFVLGADDLRIRMPLIETLPSGARTHRGVEFLVDWGNGVRHNATSLSFGQKRMLSFLWYLHLTPPGGVVFADELSNGLHADWVHQAREAIGYRQSFHAVQNPVLLDLVGPTPGPEGLLRQIVVCETQDDSFGPWYWRNPTSEEAAQFQVAWSSGFPIFSEILQDLGLW